MATFQFKIQIKGITKPPVWRQITVPENFSFYNFHQTIQIAFGWWNAHLFKFSPDGYRSEPCIQEIYHDEMDFGYREIVDATKAKLSKYFKSEKQKFTYIYDFGDSWEHVIVLEKILPEKTKSPTLIAGKGQCPPEDCGGVWGYEELKEIMKDPQHPEYSEYIEWLGLDEGEKWDPSEFDIETRRAMLENAFKQN